MDEHMFKVLDGGTATEIVRLGHTVIDRDPLWSARLLHTNPRAIVEAHKNFVRAGADYVVTVSYQASVPGFVEHLGVSEDQAHNLIKKSVELARQACVEVKAEEGTETQCLVAGSVGPYGACLHDGSEYSGNYIDTLADQELMDWHRPRLHALMEMDVDLVAVETIPCQREAEVVVQLLEKEFPGLSAWVTFSCKNSSETCHGEKLQDAVKSICLSPSVKAVGINCTDPQYITPLLMSLTELHLQKPIIVKANSGEQWNFETGWYGKESCENVCDDLVPDWANHGARWIGGCCRITPDDIRNIRQKLNNA